MDQLHCVIVQNVAISGAICFIEYLVTLTMSLFVLFANILNVLLSPVLLLRENTCEEVAKVELK